MENEPVVPAPQDDIQSQVDRLRQLIHSLLILAIVISGTFAVFLYNQLWYTRKDLEDVRGPVSQYNKTAGPATDEFLQKLVTFSKTHPDYHPIASKYGLLTNVPTVSPRAPSKASPAPVPPKK
jgi:hypothetical protein